MLNALTTIIQRLETIITSKIPDILDAVFQCTVEMINKVLGYTCFVELSVPFSYTICNRLQLQDFEEFPEHRINFFQMLQAVNQHCFPALQALPAEVLKLVVDSIVWAFRHTMRNISEIGLSILQQLLVNVNALAVDHREWQQLFYQTHFIPLLHHLFSIVTDSAHAASMMHIVQ